MHRMIIRRFNLELDGLSSLLGGDTQAAVYREICAQPGANLRVIHKRIVLDYADIAYTTVSTIANKLVAKGILARKASDNPAKREHHFYPLLTEEELIECGVALIINKLLTEFPTETRDIYARSNRNVKRR